MLTNIFLKLKQLFIIKPSVCLGFSVFFKPQKKVNILDQPSVKPSVTVSMFEHIPVRVNYSYEPYRPILRGAGRHSLALEFSTNRQFANTHTYKNIAQRITKTSDTPENLSKIEEIRQDSHQFWSPVPRLDVSGNAQAIRFSANVITIGPENFRRSETKETRFTQSVPVTDPLVPTAQETQNMPPAWAYILTIAVSICASISFFSGDTQKEKPFILIPQTNLQKLRQAYIVKLSAIKKDI